MATQSNQSANPTRITPEDAQRQHRRQVFRGIQVPLFLLAAGLVLAVVLVAWITQLRPDQMGAVADFMLIFCVLLPTVICLLPAYILFMVAAFGIGSVHNSSARQLNRLNNLTYNITERTIDVTEAVDKRVADWRVRTAGAETLMNEAFDDNTDDETGKDT